MLCSINLIIVLVIPWKLPCCCKHDHVIITTAQQACMQGHLSILVQAMPN